MMAARLLRPYTRPPSTGGSIAPRNRLSRPYRGATACALDVALRHRRLMLLLFLATVATTGYAFVHIPKGFFPQQDTGFIVGTTKTAPETPSQEMVRVSRAVADVVRHDPDVATVGMSAGAAAGLTENQGRMFVSLKPRSDRAASASRDHRPAAPGAGPHSRA